MAQTERTCTVRRLEQEDGRALFALYGRCGRDGAWCNADTVDAVFEQGAWWGGFAGGALCFCTALVAAGAALPQAEMLRQALAGEAAETLLLPPAVSEEGAAQAGALLPMLLTALHAEETPAEKAPDRAGPPRRLAAAVPVKYPPALLGGYLAAGLAAIRTRPLLSLRPNYLLTRCTVKTPKRGAVGRFYMPLEGTLAISRLLEQGYCLTGLHCLPPDERLMAEMRARDREEA